MADKRPFTFAVSAPKADVAIEIRTGLAGLTLRLTAQEAERYALELAAAAARARSYRADVRNNVTPIGERR